MIDKIKTSVIEHSEFGQKKGSLLNKEIWTRFQAVFLLNLLINNNSKTIFKKKEKYLSMINNVAIRKCFMSFRISAHKLEIEVGRYKNIPALNGI